MVDALMPAIDAMKQSLQDGVDLNQVLEQGVNVAEQGMKGTIPLQARKGRASYLGERSIGHQDPGATSSYLLLKTALDVWGKRAKPTDRRFAWDLAEIWYATGPDGYNWTEHDPAGVIIITARSAKS